MGFEDFKTGDRSTVEEKIVEVQDGSNTFERLTRSDMVGFLNRCQKEGLFDWKTSKLTADVHGHRNFDYEYVYEIPLDHPNLCIMIFSSISARTNQARDKGSDAIRTVIWDKKYEVPIGGATRTHRIETWQKNLLRKLLDLLENWGEQVEECEVCGGWLIKREGEYGPFLGCANFPDCHNTRDID